MERIPILLDTDIGSDIDDAVCLAYLLGQRRCDLLGITTVTGEPEQRARLADAICQAAGRAGVPIHAGAPVPLLTPVLQPDAPQARVLGRWKHRTDFAPDSAVDFLRQTIRARPHKIVLLAIGPLTNVGLLFALDPEIPRLLRGLVTMGGVFHTEGPDVPQLEWNIRNDPYAAAIVYRARVAGHLSVGLDVTMQCRLAAQEWRARLKGGPLDVVADAAEVWFETQSEIVFHDPLAAALIFRPDLAHYETGLVQIELATQRRRGMTHWDPAADEKPHHIAAAVEVDSFFDEYFSVFR
jgi:purine nucleosidase